MTNPIEAALQEAPIVPLIQCEDPQLAVDVANALLAGGLPVLEVVLRTAVALDCLSAIRDAVPAAFAGAGTVLNRDQAEAAIGRGAAFVVSPGLDEGVIRVTRERQLPVYPGIATAGELQRAWNLGLRVVKFFPASIAGGVAAVAAYASVFRDMRFMPTGGIGTGNLSDYLALPSVIACGGSWLVPGEALAARDFGRITELAAAALEIARQSRQ